VRGGSGRGGPSAAVVHCAVMTGVRYMEGAVRHHMVGRCRLPL